MSNLSIPVTRPTGRLLVVGQPGLRAAPVAALQRQGLTCAEVDDPYQAMRQISEKKGFFNGIVLSLNSLYREELSIISPIKQRFPNLDIWLCDTDGRQSALAEAMRLGADGLISDDGMHRVATSASISATSAPAASAPGQPFSESAAPASEKPTDPLLTAEELRALLQETTGPTNPTTPTGE